MNELYTRNDILHDLADLIAVKTLFGKGNAILDNGSLKHLCNAVPLATLYSLHQYDLNLGLKLLRVMRYLNIHRSKIFKQLMSFLLCQQRPEGSFGFLAPEISRLQDILGLEFNDSISHYLPIAFNSIWTISELIHPNFTLLHSIFG